MSTIHETTPSVETDSQFMDRLVAQAQELLDRLLDEYPPLRTQEEENDFYDLCVINDLRAKNGLPPVTAEPTAEDLEDYRVWSERIDTYDREDRDADLPRYGYE